MANNEIWKEIKGFPYYEVSNMGNVRSIDRVVTKKNNVKANIKSIQLTPQWNSILEASETLHIDNSHIGQVCCGKRKTAGGYKWKCEVAV